MPTTERTSNLLLFPSVFEYSAPSDFAGWYEPQRPYAYTSPWFTFTTQNELTHSYAGNQMAFKYNRENQFLLISYDNQPEIGNNIIINACDSLTDNGTWSVSGDGSNLILDEQIFVQGSGSLRFLITDNTGETVLTVVNQNPVDLSTIVQQGFFFLNLDCPMSNTSAITEVKLRLGSTAGLAADYYEFTSDTWYRGDVIKNGFNQIGFNALDATTNGTPDDTSLIYMSVTITNGLTGTSGIYRLDNIFGSLPTYFQLPYYSKYNIKADDGTYKLNPTATTDTILCPDDANDAMVFKTLEHLAIYNLKDQGLAMHFSALLAPYENTLKVKYPSQERRVMTAYYRSPIAF